MSQYGYRPNGYGQAQDGAMIRPPSLQDMGGQQQGQPSWVQYPFFPTSPYVSTNPNVGRQTRYYGATVNYSDSDYAVNSECVRTINFDIPCRVIAINGGGAYYNGSNVIQALPIGYRVNDLYLFRVEYSTGDKLHTGSRIASTVLGDAESPGELGGVGMTIDQGASVQLIITPLISNLRIDITFHCLEIRGQRNFN